MTNGSSQLQQEQEKLHWQPWQLQVRDRLQSAPMTSTPSLSGTEARSWGTMLSAMAQRGAEGSSGAVLPAQVVSELLLAVYMTSRAGPELAA